MKALPLERYEEYAADIREVIISSEAIQERVFEMGQAIARDYAGKSPVLVGVLKGVVPFMADLLRAITISVEVDYMAVSSYSPQTRAHGLVRILKDLDISLAGRDVLFVEDVVDTGLTLNFLVRTLRAREPASLHVCTLFNRPERRLIDVPLRYIGFDLPDRFVVGYGLDFHEKYRNLPFIGLLGPHVLKDAAMPANTP